MGVSCVFEELQEGGGVQLVSFPAGDDAEVSGHCWRPLCPVALVEQEQ